MKFEKRVQRGEIKLVGRFPFKNAAPFSLNILEVKSECRCLRAVSDRDLIKPEECGNINFEMDLRGRRGSVTKRLFVRTDAGSRSIEILTVIVHISGR
jgi:hypothetical protein